MGASKRFRQVLCLWNKGNPCIKAKDYEQRYTVHAGSFADISRASNALPKDFANDTILLETYRYIPLSQWSDWGRGPFNGLDTGMLLAFDKSTQKTAEKRSDIPHPSSGLGSLAL